MLYNKFIRAWLITGCILIFFQIVIGGITRITGSGLSITKWEIVTGTLPPLGNKAWNDAFDLYKKTPQYKKINTGMSLKMFKFIYFWEYFHRLWARIMGLLFIIPLLYFIYKKWVDKDLLVRLSYIFIAAACAAVFGWIMVASGLVERPWVNAYKLSLHLGIALVTLALVLWCTYDVYFRNTLKFDVSFFRRLSLYFFVALIVQIFLGAVLSGMRAAVYYPSWPDMNGAMIPELLFEKDSWSIEGIVDYDKDALMPALIHVLHRYWAFLVYGLGFYLVIKFIRYPFKRFMHINAIVLFVLLNIQVLLGILVLLNSKVTIPVFYGVMHQSIAIFIFAIALFNLYVFRKGTNMEV